MSSSKQGAMTTDAIKACSGQFDVESIFNLAMLRMGLRAIDNLSPCATRRPAPLDAKLH